jgi:hypothetical protein
MNADDFKKAPKLFCESVNVAYTPEYFVVAMISGQQGSIYSLTPEHAKRLSQYLAHQITEFEQENGRIDAQWNPNIVSPLQPITPPKFK